MKVVLTNGVFDLVHIGHIRLLEFCRSQGDFLVVCINSDESVRKIKGPSRPVQTEKDRAEILSALRCVDAVRIFNELDPLECIKAIRPDVLVKGGDWTRETIIGAREVESWGGKVLVFPTVEGVSTTRIVERLAGHK